MDDDERYMSRFGPMFSRGSLAKADMATDLAIPLLAEGGWSAITLRTVARAANVTPQAIAAWFPSVTAMRVAIAERYGDRWVRERDYVAHRRMFGRPRPADVDTARFEVAHALLPETWLEETFDRVWLTVVEAGRWDDAIGSVVAEVQEPERDAVAALLADRCRDVLADPGHLVDPHVDVVLALVRGLRVARTSTQDPMSAERAAEILRPRIGAVGGGVSDAT